MTIIQLSPHRRRDHCALSTLTSQLQRLMCVSTARSRTGDVISQRCPPRSPSPCSSRRWSSRPGHVTGQGRPCRRPWSVWRAVAATARIVACSTAPSYRRSPSSTATRRSRSDPPWGCHTASSNSPSSVRQKYDRSALYKSFIHQKLAANQKTQKNKLK